MSILTHDPSLSSFYYFLQRLTLFLKYLLMNKWELLAALQALSVYTIVRIDEGETEHNNLDSLMQNAIIVRLTSLDLQDSPVKLI